MAATFQDAYVRYVNLFPTLVSLGTAAATWQAELDRVSGAAFDPALATSLTVEGGNVSGIANFDQLDLIRALHARRAELDSGYANPYLTPPPPACAPRPFGSLLTFHPATQTSLANA